MNEKMDILFCANRGYGQAVYLTMLTMLRRTKETIRFHIFTMTAGEKKPLLEKDRLLFEALAHEFNPEDEVLLYDVSALHEANLAHSKNSDPVYSPYTLLRLYALQMLPKDIHTLLYLDVDILFHGDVSEFKKLDVSKVEFGAALDYLGKKWKARHYFNAGVLLINMDECRKSGLFEECIAYLKTHKVYFAEQDALNRLVHSHIEIPNRYNDQRRIRNDTIVCHYAKRVWLFWDPVKPWEISRMHHTLHIHDFDEDYRYFLAHFPFADFLLATPKVSF
jgi:lipopolysaccharide biosynthesis glycosyltransferase